MASESPKSSVGIIFVGPPGAGKGTQADLLKKRFAGRSVCHLATGDMLRNAITSGSELGQMVKPILASGGLVADDIMVALVQDAIHQDQCKDGFILDGFPRTLEQAFKLDDMLDEDPDKQLDQVMAFDIDDDLLVSRILGRWIHKASGRSYHTEFAPPKVAGKDDVTGEPLIQRSDDNADSLKTRLVAFHNQTAPVIRYYKRQGKVTTLEAKEKPAFVLQQMLNVLEKE